MNFSPATVARRGVALRCVVLVAAAALFAAAGTARAIILVANNATVAPGDVANVTFNIDLGPTPIDMYGIDWSASYDGNALSLSGASTGGALSNLATDLKGLGGIYTPANSVNPSTGQGTSGVSWLGVDSMGNLLHVTLSGTGSWNFAFKAVTNATVDFAFDYADAGLNPVGPFNATALITIVPEAPPWAALLAGLGLVAVIARCRARLRG